MLLLLLSLVILTLLSTVAFCLIPISNFLWNTIRKKYNKSTRGDPNLYQKKQPSLARVNRAVSDTRKRLSSPLSQFMGNPVLSCEKLITALV